jgi:hypothetical protein
MKITRKAHVTSIQAGESIQVSQGGKFTPITYRWDVGFLLEEGSLTLSMVDIPDAVVNYLQGKPCDITITIDLDV